MLSTLGLLSFLPASLGFNSRFYQLDVIFKVVALLVGIVVADRLQWHQYASDDGNRGEVLERADAGVRGSLRRMSQATLVLEEKRQSAAVQAEEVAEQEEMKEDMGSFWWLVYILGPFFIAFGYPLVILPVYGAKSTTECVSREILGAGNC